MSIITKKNYVKFIGLKEKKKPTTVKRTKPVTGRVSMQEDDDGHTPHTDDHRGELDPRGSSYVAVSYGFTDTHICVKSQVS